MTASGTWGRRALALGLAALVAGAGWWAVGVPLTATMATTRAQLDRERAQNIGLRQSIAMLTADAGVLADSPREGIGWRGGRRGEIEAEIQSRLSLFARQSGLALRSVEAFEGARLGEAETIGLRIEAEAPLDVAVAYLALIEANPEPLILTRANLRRLVRADPDIAQPVVDLRLELAAPLVPGAP